MKLKKYKHIDDVVAVYLTLLDEKIEIPVLIEKANEKFEQHVTSHESDIYKPAETEGMYKIFSQISKYNDRKTALDEEIAEVETTLKDFLLLLKGGKITYEKKDDNDKSKITYLFWLENDKIMSNR